jgi:hypothetical protein
MNKLGVVQTKLEPHLPVNNKKKLAQVDFANKIIDLANLA